jgi:hypothetical protein
MEIYIHNFCYNKKANIRATYYTIKDVKTDTLFLTEEELGEDYVNIKDMLTFKFAVEFDDIADFMYQNVDQTAWLKKERFIMTDVEEEFYDMLINQDNFTQEELIEIYQFGEKLKLIIQDKENEQH